MTAFFKARDGRMLATHLVECAVPLPDGSGYTLTLRSYGSAEVDTVDWMPDRLVRAARDDVAEGPDGRRYRVVFWRVRGDSDHATPVLGLALD